MLKILTLSLFVLTCLGCAPHQPLTVLNIDPYFTPAEVAVIREAAAGWQADVPFEIVENSTSKKGGWVGPEKAKKCERRSDKWGFTYQFPKRSPRIKICMEAVKGNEDALRYIVAHELGHALSGRGDHLDGHALMNEDRVGLDAPTPRDADYAYGL